jgi:hypothetical protein
VDPQQDGFVLFQPQFWVLPAWTNWGRSDYHSLQVSVRRNLGRHLFGAHYVLSKSTDNGSSFENLSSIDVNFGSTAGIAPDAIDPDANTGPSDFDLRHNVNAHWVLDLPFGSGRAVGRNAGPALDALIGGWQLSGVWRWRSGFPLSLSGINRTTLLFTNTPPALVSPIETDVTSADAAGVPNLFADPAAARTAFTYARPGSVGARNVLRAARVLRRRSRPPQVGARALGLVAAVRSTGDRVQRAQHGELQLDGYRPETHLSDLRPHPLDGWPTRRRPGA